MNSRARLDPNQSICDTDIRIDPLVIGQRALRSAHEELVSSLTHVLTTGVWTSAILRTLVSLPCNADRITQPLTGNSCNTTYIWFVHMVSEWDSTNSRPLRYWDDSHQDAYISRDQLTGVCLIHVSEEVVRRQYLHLSLGLLLFRCDQAFERYICRDPLWVPAQEGEVSLATRMDSVLCIYFHTWWSMAIF